MDIGFTRPVYLQKVTIFDYRFVRLVPYFYFWATAKENCCNECLLCGDSGGDLTRGVHSHLCQASSTRRTDDEREGLSESVKRTR